MTHELRSTHDACGIKWPALSYHIPCRAHVIQLAFVELMSSFGVKGCTKWWEDHERDQRFGENESIDIGKSQTLRKVGNASINQVSAMRLGLAKLIEKVHIAWYVESTETDHHIAENACCIDYTHTWSSKQVYWLSKSLIPHCSTSDYEWENTFEQYIAVTPEGLLITSIHRWVASKSKIHQMPATVHNSRWMYNCDVCHGCIEAIPILDPVDVEEACSHIPSHYHSVQ